MAKKKYGAIYLEGGYKSCIKRFAKNCEGAFMVESITLERRHFFEFFR